MDSATEEEWSRLLKFFEDLRSHGVFTTMALPYVLIHNPAESIAAADRLSKDLCSDSEKQVAAAINAVRHWAHLSFNKKVTSLPPRLVSVLIRRIVLREKVGLQPILIIVALLLLERPEVFSRADIDLIVSSLVTWHRVLDLACKDESSTEFDDRQKPYLRTLVGRLAGSIDVWLKSTVPSELEPEAIALWREKCQVDPLPEVRRSFDDWSSFQRWLQNDD